MADKQITVPKPPGLDVNIGTGNTSINISISQTPKVLIPNKTHKLQIDFKS
jgi:hypothetical protein